MISQGLQRTELFTRRPNICDWQQ